MSLPPTVYRTLDDFGLCSANPLNLGDRTQYNLSDTLPGLVEDLSLAQPSTGESRSNCQSITGNWMIWMHLDELDGGGSLQSGNPTKHVKPCNESICIYI